MQKGEKLVEKNKIELLNRINQAYRGAKILDSLQGSFRGDGYSNLLNKYGTAQDNGTSYSYDQEKYVNDSELINLYEGNGLFAKIIDRPSDESVKHGLDIDYGDESISEYVDERLDGLDFEDKFSTAEKWARLYGGSIIVMLCNDGGGLEEPLDWDKVTSIDELVVFERAVVTEDYSGIYRYGIEETLNDDVPIGQPIYYHVNSVHGYFTVHYTRCLLFRNGRLPEQTTSSLYRHWGMPEYVKIREALRECVTAHSNGTKLLERSVQAIYKMQNLASLLSSESGEDKVLQRLQVIDMARGILNSIAIDANGEDYDFKTLPMSGVKDVIDTTCNMLSAVTNIPQTILFGRSPAGMNSTGDSDLENYYNMVENIQKQNMKKNIRTLINLILKQGFLEGDIQDIPKFKVKFSALWSLSDTEQADIAQKKAQTEQIKAQTAQAYIDAGVLDASEVRRSLATEGEFEIEEVITEDDIELPEDTFSPIGEEGNSDDAELEVKTEVQADGDCQAAAVLVIKDGKILCGRRTGTDMLCGPGGHMEEGESTEDTAVREAMEEFNIVPLNIIPLGRCEASSEAYCDSMVYFTDQYTGKEKADEVEMSDVQWLSIGELMQANLFPPFKKSLILLTDLLDNLLTYRNGSATLNAPETIETYDAEDEDWVCTNSTAFDGGKGSGNFGHKGVPGQRGGSSSSLGWSEDFPKVCVQTNGSKMKSHPGYQEAKHGNYDSAKALVNDVIKPDRVKQLAEAYPDAVVVPVRSSGKDSNQIPVAYADAISKAGIPVDKGIVITEKANRTGSSELNRLVSKNKLEGEVKKGQNYIIADDVVTSGASINEYRKYIEKNGGKVVASTALCMGQQGSNQIAPKTETLDKAIEKHGKPLLNEVCKSIGVGELESLTTWQVTYLRSCNEATLKKLIKEGEG